MPVLHRVQDDGSGIQRLLKLLESGFRQNDIKDDLPTFYESIRALMVLFFSL
jgi:hypothetical protein